MKSTAEQTKHSIDLSNGAAETFVETWRVGPVPEFDGEILAAQWGSELYERIEPVAATYSAKFAGWYPSTEAEWELSRRDAVLAYHSENTPA